MAPEKISDIAKTVLPVAVRVARKVRTPRKRPNGTPSSHTIESPLSSLTFSLKVRVGASTPAYVIQFDVGEDGVRFIRDYRYVTYLSAAFTFAVIE